MKKNNTVVTSSQKLLIILKFFKGRESSDQGECFLKAVFVTLENKQSQKELLTPQSFYELLFHQKMKKI